MPTKKRGRPSTLGALDEKVQKHLVTLRTARIKTRVRAGNIPPQLIVNWDQSSINIVPSSEWTLAQESSKRVEIAGLGDKWQISCWNTQWKPAAIPGSLLEED